MAKKKAEEKALNLDQILFNCRDYLRAARNSGSFFEKRDMMLTLVFLRFIGEKYEDGIEKLKQELRHRGLTQTIKTFMQHFLTTLPSRMEPTIFPRKHDGTPSLIHLLLA